MADPEKKPEEVMTPPVEVKDKADLAAVRMMEREKADREKMEREKIMSTATMDAAAARTAMASKEMPRTESEAERERMKAGAAMTGAAMATGAAVTRTETTRITPERPVTGTVVPPGTERVTPMKPYGTVDERSRMHAEDPSVHPDWETQPQINAPRDVGIQTPEGQADAARIQAGRRRSDESKEPRLERRGEDVSVPAASSARTGGVTGAAKETARDVKEKTKETASEVKEDVNRKI